MRCNPSALMEVQATAPAFATRASVCLHCGNEVPARLAGEEFCCQGCRTVHSILNARGLGQYYELKALTGGFRKASPVQERSDTFDYLDDPEFQKSYAIDGVMRFYLEGVHCLACIWLVEKLPELVPGVKAARLDLGTSVATVTIAPGGSFAACARELQKFGYRPHAVRDGESEIHQKRENLRMLLRLGVAGACAGNIMLLAISVYGGASGWIASLFNWVSFALTLPVLFYSATPFYKSAWSSLRARSVSIDLPLAGAILLGAVLSTVNLIRGSDHVYFDSITALVFLLLATRYLLLRSQQAALRASSLALFLTPSVVRKRMLDGVIREVQLDSVFPEDVLEVRAGEIIPVDGQVIEVSSQINGALLTGEAEPSDAAPGTQVFAGTVNTLAPLLVKVSARGAASRLGKILSAVERDASSKSTIVGLADRYAKYFVAGVLVLAAGVFMTVSLAYGLSEGLDRTLALLIVTCPCALALATPLGMSFTLGKAARAGMIIKGAQALEKLAHVREVWLDKTGTITAGNFEVVEWRPAPWLEEPGSARLRDLLPQAVVTLESRSHHPLGRAITRHIQAGQVWELLPVERFREDLGKGVSGQVEGRFFELLQWRGEGAAPGTAVAVRVDGKLAGTLLLGDRVREDSASAIRALRSIGVEPGMLTGDTWGAALQVGERVGISRERIIAECSPEGKSSSVKGRDGVLMVGDGANDAVALASAYVGVAVHGGMEISLRAADGYLQSPGVMPIYRMIVLARETIRVIRRNLVFSLFYNFVGAGATIAGWVTPLFAAFFMPVSAFTVFTCALIGTRRMRAILREAGP